MENRREKTYRGDMTTGNAMRKILCFAIPLFVGNIFQQVYNMADTVIAGYTLGDQAIAAIGATSSLYSLLIDFFSGLNSGFGIVVAQAFGARDEGKVKRSVAMMLLLNIGLTILLTMVALLLLRPMMGMLEVPDSIFEQAYQYIFVIFAGMLTTIFYNMFAGILRALGNSSAPLFFLVIACVLNLGLDVLFMVGFQWGVAGAALATVIAQACSAILCGIYLWKVYPDMLPRKEDFRADSRLLREMWTTGSAMALMLCVVDLGSVLYQRGINGLGDQLIVAHTAARKLITMLMMPLGSLATAYSTFVSQNFGAGKRKRIRETLPRVLGIEIGWGILCFVVMLGFGGTAVTLLTNTSDTTVIQNAVVSLRCHFLCFPALGVLLVLRTALQAIGHKLFPVMSSGFELAIKLIAGIWLIPSFGYIIACLTEPVIWIVSMVFLWIVFIKIKPLQKDDAG